jgi:hypothetical protein
VGQLQREAHGERFEAVVAISPSHHHITDAEHRWARQSAAPRLSAAALPNSSNPRPGIAERLPPDGRKTNQGTKVMDVAKLPAMEDAALSVLHENAERLERTGTKAQQAAAAALMPAIEAELAARRAAKLSQAKEAAAAKRAARPATPKRTTKRKAS